MKIQGMELEKLSNELWEIPKTGKMQVPGRIYITEEMIQSNPDNSEAFKQVRNVAHLPGIVKYSLAMPDIHWGYGFPIGGVAATDHDTGVISPGGVGYDINCGVRLAGTGLQYNQVKAKLDKVVKELFNSIPTGVGASGAIKKLSKSDFIKMLTGGSAWAVEQGFGSERDVEFTEENGCMQDASGDPVSERAFERGYDQVGTLGSGNHFLEVGVVSEIYDEAAAKAYGLIKDQITLLIHTGSRGFGYQICDEYAKSHLKASGKFGFDLPDRQLACAPVKSEEGQNYYAAMCAAANFAWTNRQVILHLANQALQKSLGIKERDLRLQQVYDVCHNVAKVEEHNIDGTMMKLMVHRKGATRAFGPGSKEIPAAYSDTGQPVLIPGDMGRYTFVCAGTGKAMEDTFGSSCHGAGRIMSRRQATKSGKGRNILQEMKKRGILVQAKKASTLSEEMPSAYKDVQSVVDVMHNAGITKKVVKLKPLAVIKG